MIVLQAEVGADIVQAIAVVQEPYVLGMLQTVHVKHGHQAALVLGIGDYQSKVKCKVGQIT